MKKRINLTGCVLAVLFVFIGIPKAESLADSAYPRQTIEIVVPFSPGGPLDLGTRYFCEKWSEFLGQPVVAVNKHGASGAVAAREVARSAANGYTFLAASDTPLINARLGRDDTGYDLSSFRMVLAFSDIVMFYSVRAGSDYRTFKDLVEDAKKHPGKVKYATHGRASATALSIEMVSDLSGASFTLVPSKSSPDSLALVAGGNVDLAVTWSLGGMGQTAMIVPVAVSSEERLLDYPDVPTLKELGYPIIYTSQSMGIAAPAKTPDYVIKAFNEAHKKVIAKYAEEMKERLPKIDQYPNFLDGKTYMEKLIATEELFKEFMSKVADK